MKKTQTTSIKLAFIVPTSQTSHLS